MTMHRPIPILRMFDVEQTKRFYVEWLGFELTSQEGEGDRPVFMTVQRDDARLHLSSHHGDGTPGAVVLIPLDDVAAFHAELQSRPYPFMHPGLDERGSGREVLVLDPASNQLRFFQPG